MGTKEDSGAESAVKRIDSSELELLINNSGSFDGQVDPPEDLAKLMDRPISVSLVSDDPAESARVAAMCQDQHILLNSLGQLFLALQPPTQVLILVRDFAKRHLASPQSPIGRHAARVIYLGTIAAALVRNGEWISSLSREQVDEQWKWALSLDSLPAPIRELFAVARKQNGMLSPQA
jgi:hypothetical protein